MNVLLQHCSSEGFEFGVDAQGMARVWCWCAIVRLLQHHLMQWRSMSCGHDYSIRRTHTLTRAACDRHAMYLSQAYSVPQLRLLLLILLWLQGSTAAVRYVYVLLWVRVLQPTGTLVLRTMVYNWYSAPVPYESLRSIYRVRT